MREAGPQRLLHFREFAQALWPLKQRAKDETLAGIRSEISALLEQQERYERDPEYLYALAAFADEVFLTLDWPFRQEWRTNLMETRRFGSQAAGERIFAQIDALLESDATARAPMAPVYLLMLGLGFRGRFRQPGQQPEIEQRRAALWAMVARRQPELLGNGQRLAPQAYEHTLQDGALLQLASPQRWWLLSAAVALTWLAAATFAWRQLAEPVTTRIEAVERKLAAERLPREGR